MEIARKKANEHYNAAYHFLNMTFDLLKNPKILLSVVTNISKSMEFTRDAILMHGRKNKYIPAFGKDQMSRNNAFIRHAMPKHKINESFTQLTLDLNKVVNLHNRSPVEFPRGERFIICNETYDITTLSAETLRKYLSKSQEFINKMDQILN